MSLVCWIPLAGNTNQQGTSSITMSGSPNSWVDGKLGKCAHFTGSAANVIYNNTTDFNYTDNFSYAVWIKHSYSSGGANQYAFTVGRADAGGYGYSIAVGSSLIVTTFGNRRVPISCPENQWHHVAVTISGTTMKTYFDGVLANTSATATIPTYSDGNGLGLGCFHYSGNIYPYYGDLQDFRIYDHCLSPKEVELIARGLVLHYPMTGGGRGGDNLLPHTSVDEYGLGYLNGYSSGTITVDTTEKFGGKSTILVQPSSSSTSSGGTNAYNNSVALESGKTYCYSCWIKSTVADTFDFYSLGHYQVIAGSDLHADTNRNYIMNTIPANTWTKVALTFTPTAAAQFRSFFIYFANTSQKIWISDVKLELGSYPTSWMPNLLDSSYTSMGYNDNTEYDVSGYNNHGTKNGTVTYSSDTARYSVSTTFNGSNTYIESNPLPISTRTISLWLKTSWSSAPWYQIAVHDMNTGLAIGWSGVQLITYVGSSNGGAGSRIDTTNIWTANKWHHVVIVKTGDTTRTVYIDGVLQSPSSANFWGGDLMKLNIGNRHYNGSYSAYFNGQLSDFRAYATELTSAQVAELYITSASISNNGTLMGYEFIEQ